MGRKDFSEAEKDMKTLAELMPFIGCSDICDSTVVSGLTFDSRRCQRGDLFFCKGRNFRREYAEAALESGAVALVCEGETAKVLWELPRLIITDDIHKAMSECAAYFYDYPMKRLKSIAVTGTKGKSTTAFFINSALNFVDACRSILLSDAVSPDAPRLTTPEAIDFQKAAEAAVKKGYTHIVCEISSQAQKMKRAYGMHFDIGVFLNLGADHISEGEHASEEEYFECKRSLFDACDTAVVNISDPYGVKILENLPENTRAFTFSVADKNADFFAEKIKTDAFGCDLLLFEKGKKEGTPLVIPSIGRHNAENALAAAGTLCVLGADKRQITLGLAVGTPAGRGEVLKSADGNVTIIVDYAHNEMSFRAMLETARNELAGATVTVVFGCPGDKAKCRRGQIARVCAEMADKVIICDDDSGSEGYEAIRDEMMRCFEQVCDDNSRMNMAGITFIESRGDAIKTAVNNACENGGKQVILFLGKGDEAVNRTRNGDKECEKDTELTKKALELCENKLGLMGALREKERILAVPDCSEEILKELAASLPLICDGVFVICDKKAFKILEYECYKHSISVYGLDETELCRILKEGGKIPALPICVTEKDINRCVKRAARVGNFDKIVYLRSDKGIIFNEKITVKSLSLSRAKIIADALEGSYAKDFVNRAVYAGQTAFIDGKNPLALARYLLKKSYFGTVINGE